MKIFSREIFSSSLMLGVAESSTVTTFYVFVFEQNLAKKRNIYPLKIFKLYGMCIDTQCRE